MRTKNPRCPKCNSNHLILRELTECWAEWELVGDRFTQEKADLNPGAVAGVWGSCCRCGHWWKLKKVLYIEHLPAYQDLPQ